MLFSEDPLNLQFQGFFETPALWRSRGNFGMEQFIPSPLPAFPIHLESQLNVPNNLVLGRRVEFFLDYYLQQFSEEEILGRNLVIYSGKRTLGELDFLLQNRKTRSLTHLELIYKFYVYDPSINDEQERWIGPNRGDTLTRKIQKLKEHQLPLLFQKETKELLESFGAAPEDFEQKVCYKANLFVPQDFLTSYFPMINRDCIQGVWIKAADFLEQIYGQHYFHIPQKWDWPIHPSFCREWTSYGPTLEVINRLHQENKSPLIWMKNVHNEFSRFFVVWW